MEPVVARLAQSGIRVQKVMIDQRPDVAKQYRIDGVPTFVAVVNGQEVDRQVGATSYEELARFCQQTGLAQSTSQAAPASAPRRTPARPASSSTGSASQLDEQIVARCMAASVRISIADPQGMSTGSGTIIDSLDGEALVLTCGHIFRENNGQGRVSVDLFGGNAPQDMPGKVIGYDLRADVALVVIETPYRLPSMPVAPEGYRSQIGNAVVAIGCPHGRDPEIQRTRIVSQDKYLGPPNVQVAGRPVQGRSGGGLFSHDGYVIGVCNAADVSADEGLYAALGSIHTALGNADLMHLARPASSTPAAQPEPMMAQAEPQADAFASAPRRDLFQEAAPENEEAPAAVSSYDDQPLARRAGPFRPGSTAGGATPQSQPDVDVSLASHAASEPVRSSDARSMSGQERAAIAEISRRGDHAEVICIVRSLDDPRGRSEIIVLDRASPDFLDMLVSQRKVQDGRTLTDMTVERPAPSNVSQDGWRGAER
jgi:S1-C subfamily serine protease